MKVYLGNFALLIFSLLIARCSKGGSSNVPTAHDSIPSIKAIVPTINEISGIADSKANKGFLWGQEDSGNQTEIYLIGHDGKLSKSIYIKGAVNRDWEDMALAGTDLFVGDIGDNNKAYSEYTIYQFPEPPSTTDTVANFITIRFKYTDGSRDAEAFLIDPQTKDIYLITKSDNPSKIYKISYPYAASLNTAKAVGSLPYGGVVSAALSPDRKTVIIKTYVGLNRYSIASNESIEAALQKSATKLPYQLEPQGEAVCFAADNSGYFTLSEKGMGRNINLYFYKLK